jgi:succinate dehydrogenase / fumarate reductase flavoprotein subunit
VREGRGIEGKDFVHLDLTHLGEEKIQERLWEIASFARIYAGVEPTCEPIPVQPTCHYMMGGIPTDSDGRVLTDSEGTAVPGLFAAGECACVSVHGANRLGCNSLLDLVVFGRRTGKAIGLWLAGDGQRAPASQGPSRTEEKLEQLLSASGKEMVSEIRHELQSVMTDKCSVFRKEEELQEARGKVRELRERYRQIGLSVREKRFNMELVEAIECGHLLNLAAVIVESALNRRESRGAHSREDYQARDDKNYLVHTLAYMDDREVRIDTKPVNVTRFQPVERTY